MKKIDINQQDCIKIACQYLKKGKIISFATETVYGLACDASNKNAVDELYSLKNRSHDKPIAIFVKDLDVAYDLLIFDDLAKNIAQKYLPGSLTMVLKKNKSSEIKLAENLNMHDEFLGFRISSNDFVQKLMLDFDGVMAVTSANISGTKAANYDFEVEKYFANSKLDLLICNGACASKIASTVVKIVNNELIFLRYGEVIPIPI